MKICMLTNTYRPHVGGVAASVETLAAECRRAGHSVRIITPGFPGKGPEDDGEVLRVPALQQFNGSDFSVRVPIPNYIAARIADFDPDIVHAHHPFLLGDAALRLAYARQLPLVFTHHTLYENYTHYVPFDSPALRGFVVRLASDYANDCDGVIAPSQSVADLLASRGVDAPLQVIPTGVDTQAFATAEGAAFRQARGIPAEARVLGHVGRLAQEKNLDYLGAAVTHWLACGGNRHFLLVGDGPRSRALRQRFQEAGVGDRVSQPGKLTGDTLRDAYAAMDAFAFASTTETQGMVVAEAMAAGLPVFALDASGVRDVVVDGDNGRLLPLATTAQDFADAIEQGMNAATHDGWAANARRRAQTFDRGYCADRVMGFYSSLQATSRRPKTDHDWRDRLLGRIEAEWELISTKADSATDTLRERIRKRRGRWRQAR